MKGVESDIGFSIPELYVDGGMTVNNLLLQIQADFINKTVGKSNYWTVRLDILQNIAISGSAELVALTLQAKVVFICKHTTKTLHLKKIMFSGIVYLDSRYFKKIESGLFILFTIEEKTMCQTLD